MAVSIEAIGGGKAVPFIDISANSIALGDASSGSNVQYSALSTPASGVLRLSGATGQTCRLTGLSDPTAATDAVTQQWVQQQLSKTTNGLALKQLVQLCATTNVNLTAAASSTLLRKWPGLVAGNLLTKTDWAGLSAPLLTDLVGGNPATKSLSYGYYAKVQSGGGAFGRMYWDGHPSVLAPLRRKGSESSNFLTISCCKPFFTSYASPATLFFDPDLAFIFSFLIGTS